MKLRLSQWELKIYEAEVTQNLRQIKQNKQKTQPDSKGIQMLGPFYVSIDGFIND